jgi:hypothetical protein
VNEIILPETALGKAVAVARERWHLKHGKCSMCSVGEKPINGKHRGQFHCGNDDACMLCRGCITEGEQCRACGRINMEVTANGG